MKDFFHFLQLSPSETFLLSIIKTKVSVKTFIHTIKVKVSIESERHTLLSTAQAGRLATAVRLCSIVPPSLFLHSGPCELESPQTAICFQAHLRPTTAQTHPLIALHPTARRLPLPHRMISASVLQRTTRRDPYFFAVQTLAKHFIYPPSGSRR